MTNSIDTFDTLVDASTRSFHKARRLQTDLNVYHIQSKVLVRVQFALMKHPTGEVTIKMTTIYFKNISKREAEKPIASILPCW